MRILLTMNVPLVRCHGGANRSNRAIARALVRAGHEVHVVCPATAPGETALSPSTLAHPGTTSYCGVHLHAPMAQKDVLPTLRRCLDEVQPDSIMVSSEDPSQSLLEAALRYDERKVTYLAHTPQLMPFGYASLFPSVQRTALVARATRVVTISRFMADYVAQYAQIRADVVHPPHYDTVVQASGRRDGAVLLLNACEVKGIAIFSDMAAALPHVRFRAAPGYGSTRADRERLSAFSNVSWIDNRESLDELLHDCAALVMPSLWIEGFGMACVDAMQRGVPVLAAHHSGLVEASLGAAKLLEVARIERFEEELGDNYLPQPVVPPQPTKIWIEALTDLLANDQTYTKCSVQATHAASAFVRPLTIEPLVTVLQSGRRTVKPRPTSAGAASTVATLTTTQRDLLIRKAAARALKARRPIPRVDGEEGLASFAQRRLWFLQRLSPQSSAYNIPLAIRVEGPLDTSTLQYTLSDLVKRHEVLRTTLVCVDEDLLQRIEPHATPPLPMIDLTCVPATVIEAEIARIAEDICAVPFVLSIYNNRTALLRVGPRDHVLLWSIHHAAVDGWSIDLLARDAIEIYQARCEGRPPPSREQQLRFLDVAAWERRVISGDREAALLSFWQSALAGCTAAPLSFAAASSDGGESGCSTLGFSVSGDELAPLRRLLQAEQATLFMGLATLLQLLLYRYTGDTDLPIGTTMANRRQQAFERVVGPFVNTLVLRARTERNTSFREALVRMRACVIAAADHQELPFDRVVAAVSPVRSADEAPLFRVFIVLQNTPGESQGEVSGLRFSPIPIKAREPKWDLGFGFTETADGLLGALEYRSNIINDEMARQLLAHFQALLRTAAADPVAPVWRLPMLETREPAVELPRQSAGLQWVDALFSEQARKTPDNPAVISGGQQVTYRSLAAKSDAIAGGLGYAGVRADDIVAVDLPRTPDLIAALLGIWKAGAAWLPLDPRWPEERRRRVLLEARPAQIVDQAALTRLLNEPPWTGAGPVRSGAGLAYVLYTSGSTGAPKGVAIEHRNLVNLLRWGAGAFSQSELARVLAATTLSFDLAVFEIFAPLVVGGCAVLVEDLFALAACPEVSLINTVPSIAMEAAELRLLPPGVAVNLAGEVLAPRQVEQLYAGVRPSVLRDLYGPTECCVYATSAMRKPGDCASIGKVIAGSELRIVDAWLDSVPDGCVGEIVIGGPGVGRGYLRSPRLTAERFVPDPSHPGGRMYRTGDRGRRQTDGSFEFLGRMDAQVKLRGFRIELGEIEQAALAVAGVNEAAAVVSTVASGSIVLAVSGMVDHELLAAHLHSVLPSYAVPARIFRMDRLPRLPNGKLDRARLAELQPETPNSTIRVPPAGGHARRILAAIWSDVLGLPVITPATDFFQEGGHSLAAIRVTGRIAAEIGVAVPLRALFETPVFGAFAARVEASSDALPSPTRRLRLPGRIEHAPLTRGQSALWIEAAAGAATRSVIGSGLRLTAPAGVDVMRQAWESLVTRHGALRTAVIEHELGPIQEIVPTVAMHAPCIDLCGIGASRLEAVLTEIRSQIVSLPFELAKSPLWRLWIVRLPNGETEVLLAIHHLVCDGWSLDILAAEWLAAVKTLQAGGMPQPREPAWQLADVAAWQTNGPNQARAAQSASYWIAELGNEMPSLPASQHYTRGSVAVEISADLVQRLAPVARRLAITPFMVAVGLAGAAAARAVGRTRVRAGVVLAGRVRPEWEGVVGCLAALVPIRCDISEPSTLADYLRHVREALLDAEAHSNARLEDVLIGLGASPRAGTPVDFTFNLAEAPSISESTVLGVAMPGAGPKFPWSVWLREDKGRWVGEIEFDQSVLDDRVAQAQAAAFVRLVRAFVTDPAQSLAKAAGPTAAECAALLHSAGTTGTPDRPPLFWQRFGALIARQPGGSALVWPGARMTYGELANEARAFASRLWRQGVTPGTTAAIVMRSGPESAIAVLALWFIGASFVAIDPRVPQTRMREIVRRAGSKLILTQHACVATAARIGCAMIAVDLGAVTAPDPEIVMAEEPEHLAYLVFTSGSTGTPKLVEVTHGGLAQTMAAQALYLPIAGTDYVGRFAPPGVDAWVWDLTLALAHGAALWCGEPEEWPEAGVTVATVVPSVLAEWCSDEFPRLRLLISAGETCSSSLWRRWSVGRKIVNAYGPAEASIWVTAYEGPCGAGSVPIGTPVPGSFIYVLDRDGELAAPGEIGEIAVGGNGVSPGYRGDPQDTADRFRPNPFAKRPGARLYRTGDFGYWRGDGTLEFVGRRDSIVKIAGHRVSLGEVEAALAAIPGVLSCAAVLQEGSLQAFVGGGDGLDGATVRRQVAERLPAHMTPQSVRVLRALPRLPGGKLDRAALLRMTESHVKAALPVGVIEPVASAPVDKTVNEIAGTMAAVLGVPQIGAEQDFFASGGHSMSGLRVILELRRRGLRRTLSQLFLARTPAALAAFSEQPAGPQAWQIAHGPIDGPTPLTAGQTHLLRLHEAWSDKAAFNVPVVAKLTGPVTAADLRAVWSELVMRHSMLRVVVATSAVGFAMAPIDVSPSFEVTDLASEPEPADLAAEAILIERTRPFDLAVMPPVRARALRLKDNFHVLLITGHHIAVDGWSFDVLARDATHLLHRRLDPRIPALPPLARDIQDYARAEAQWLTSREAATTVEWWRDRLGSPPALRAPTHRISNAECRLDAQHARPLVILAGRLGLSVFVALLGCVQALMLLIERDRRPRVATLVANREAPGCEDLVGLFVDTRVVVGEPDLDLPFGLWLQRAGADAVEALYRRPLPFAWLAERLQHQAPLFDTLFVFNQPTAVPLNSELAGFGIEFEVIEVGAGGFLPGAPTNLGAILTAHFSGDVLHLGLRLGSSRLTGDAASALAALERLIARGIADPERPLRELAE